jgi:hypothetical protein
MLASESFDSIRFRIPVTLASTLFSFTNSSNLFEFLLRPRLRLPLRPRRPLAGGDAGLLGGDLFRGGGLVSILAEALATRLAFVAVAEGQSTVQEKRTSRGAAKLMPLIQILLASTQDEEIAKKKIEDRCVLSSKAVCILYIIYNNIYTDSPIDIPIGLSICSSAPSTRSSVCSASSDHLLTLCLLSASRRPFHFASGHARTCVRTCQDLRQDVPGIALLTEKSERGHEETGGSARSGRSPLTAPGTESA